MSRMTGCRKSTRILEVCGWLLLLYETVTVPSSETSTVIPSRT